MTSILIFIICFSASIIGSVVGLGGGVIIKPLLDLTALIPINTINFASGCTVLMMSLSSLFFNRKSEVKLNLKVSTPLAVGAVIGGILGKNLFELLKTSFVNHNLIVVIQNIFILTLTALVFIYISNKKSIKSLNVTDFRLISLIGLILGLLSSFLGIGGGPINLAVLYFFFGMEAKIAAKNSLFIILFSQISSFILSIISKTVPDIQSVNIAVMIAGGVVGALIGKEISKKINNNKVEFMFKISMILIIILNICNIIKYR